MPLPITSKVAPTLPTKQGIVHLNKSAATCKVYLYISVNIDSIFFPPLLAFAQTKVVPPEKDEVIFSVCRY